MSDETRKQGRGEAPYLFYFILLLSEAQGSRGNSGKKISED